MKPHWFHINNLPFENMWKEARIWYPVFFKETSFEACFSFDDHGEIIDHNITKSCPPEH